jgi:aspartate kinase
VDEAGNITTLGRGGSDTTGVAIAAALGADVCEIYTDVDGVYTADPRLVTGARKIERISYESMLELASVGAKVLQIRSVEMGAKYKVPIHVRSSFNDEPGTWVVPEEKAMEHVLVDGVALVRDESKITVRAVPDVPGVAARLLAPLAKAGIVIDIIVQNVSEDGTTDVTFTVPRLDRKRAIELLTSQAADLCAPERVTHTDAVAKISVVGIGMRSHAGVAQRMFQILADEGINIQMISTSEIKISCVIDEKYSELALRALHQGFGLDRPPTERPLP